MTKPGRSKLVTPIGIFSFPSVFKPMPPMKGQAPNPNAKDKFGTTIVWRPADFNEDDKQRWIALLSAIDALAIEKFKSRMKDCPAHIKRPIRDGIEKAHLSGFGQGTYFANITSHMKPGIVGADGKTEIIDPADIYAGCYGRASVTIFYYNNVSTGIALGLSNLKKIKDGPRLDSKTTADHDFEDLGEADLELAGASAGAVAADDFL